MITIDELADILYSAGWDSPNDAQHDRLRKLHAHIASLEIDAKRYRAIADPCSGAEQVIFNHVDKEGFRKRLKSGTALDAAVDSLVV